LPKIGTGEIILLLLLALLLFGAKRLPEIGRSLGSGMREFKDSVTGNSRDDPELLAPRERQSLESSLRRGESGRRELQHATLVMFGRPRLRG
jgi:sec-independent protein translocase protein TatA